MEVKTGERVSSVSPTRVTLKSGTELKAHTLVWGAGLQATSSSSRWGSSSSEGTASASVRSSTLPDHPEVYIVGDIAAITDAKTEQVLPQLGSVALQSGEHVGEVISHRIAGKKTKPFKYKDKGTMAAIGRGAAVVQMLGGRTMKGKRAKLAWLTVHLALLPTNEDRAKAVVDWAGSGLTHARAGRITVERTRNRRRDGRCSRRSPRQPGCARPRAAARGHDCSGALRRVGRATDAALAPHGEERRHPGLSKERGSRPRHPLRAGAGRAAVHGEGERDVGSPARRAGRGRQRGPARADSAASAQTARRPSEGVVAGYARGPK